MSTFVVQTDRLFADGHAGAGLGDLAATVAGAAVAAHVVRREDLRGTADG